VESVDQGQILNGRLLDITQGRVRMNKTRNSKTAWHEGSIPNKKSAFFILDIETEFFNNFIGIL
jgi:hypothetical protein